MVPIIARLAGPVAALLARQFPGVTFTLGEPDRDGRVQLSPDVDAQQAESIVLEACIFRQIGEPMLIPRRWIAIGSACLKPAGSCGSEAEAPVRTADRFQSESAVFVSRRDRC